MIEREVIRKAICKYLGAMAFAEEPSHFNDYMNSTTDLIMEAIKEQEIPRHEWLSLQPGSIVERSEMTEVQDVFKQVRYVVLAPATVYLEDKVKVKKVD